MSLTVQHPTPGVFGYEVADDINKNKSLLSMCIAALAANGIKVPLPLPATAAWTAPGISSGGSHYSGTPIDIEKQMVKDLYATMATGTFAVLTLPGSVAGGAIKLTAKLAGAPGALVSAKVESGSISGAKITITDGITPEVYDNVATSPLSGVVSALAGSALVTAAVVGTGDIVVSGPTHLAVGVPVTPPTFGGTQSNDDQSVAVQKWARAAFDALRTAGYIA